MENTSIPGTPVSNLPTAAADAPRKKFSGLKTSNSQRAVAPKRKDFAQMGVAVDTKLSDLQDLVKQFQADIAAGIKEKATANGVDLSQIKLADVVIRGTLYAQAVFAAE